MNRVILAIFIVFLASCAGLKKKDPADDQLAMISKPLPPEKREELLQTYGENWLYGQGIGETTLNVGTSIAFPPYILYLLGNAALDISGYEQYRITDALPTQEKAQYDEVYNEVTGAPGKLAADMSGEEYRTKKIAREKVKETIK